MAATQDAQTSNGNLSALHDRLDALWAQYLQLLDDYTTAQAAIKKHLASGLFSLTQANFQAKGRRFGSDFYDDRAVALTRVKAGENGRLTMIQVQGEATMAEGDEHRGKESHASNQGKKDAEAEQLPSPSPTPEPEPRAKSETETEDATKEEKTENSVDSVALRDPLRWFGILIPPPLRAAQKSFSSAVQDNDAVIKAVNAARSMRDIEVEIRKLRKMTKKAKREAAA